MGEHDGGQAAPKPGTGRPIAALVRADVKSFFAGSEYVQQALTGRQQLGTERYGTPLQAGNGRDWLLDAFEEALDLAQYLRQGLEEGSGVFTNYMQALHLVMSLGGQMQRRSPAR